MSHYFYIPNNLDIDSILANDNSFELISGFSKDYLHYILHLIAEVPANNKDKINQDGYTYLHSDILRQWCWTYEKYKDYLIKNKVLETDNCFTMGKKSKGYRFTQKYRVEPKKVFVSEPKLIQKLNAWYSTQDYSYRGSSVGSGTTKIDADECSVAPDQYLNIARWYNPSIITIDAQAAHSYNRMMYEYKKDDRALWDREAKTDGSQRLKDPYMQYIAGFRNVEKLREGRYNLHADGNVRRLHSAITNCKKELRNFIQLNGQAVSCVDLSNSQPTLLLCLLDLAFWDGTGSFNHTHIPYINTHSIFKDAQHQSLLIKLLENLRVNEYVYEVERYRKMVVGGRFYEDFSSLVRDGSGKVFTKAELKPMMFTVLFTDNRFIAQDAALPKRLFKEMFPHIYDVLCCIKKMDPSFLPILLQRIESYVMYYRICPAVANAHPNLPIIPIHDSIATIQGYESAVESIMARELAACLGVTPHFKTEHWEPQAVHSLAA